MAIEVEMSLDNIEKCHVFHISYFLMNMCVPMPTQLAQLYYYALGVPHKADRLR